MNSSIILLSQSSNPAHTNIHLMPGRFVLGRSLSCNYVVNDRSVSRQHAEIAFVEESLWIHDLKSSNGTYVDGVVVRRCCVSLGNIIRFGKVSFKLASQEAKPLVIDPEEETDKCDDLGEFLDQGNGELTDAQKRVFKELIQGFDEKAIGKRLFLSPHTVHNHLKAIYKVFRVHSRVELMAKLLEKNGDSLNHTT